MATVTMRKLKILLLSCIAAFSLWSLASGADYLESRLPGGLPFGSALAAAGLAALAGIAVALSRQGSAIRAVSWIALALAAAWLPASIALAGNLELSFPGGGARCGSGYQQRRGARARVCRRGFHFAASGQA